MVWMLLLGSFAKAAAQIAMPDTVCVGTTRQYRVNDATVPSTYTWQVNGVTQAATGYQLTVTWSTAGVFTVTVQEHPANGCAGDVRSGLVYVNPPPVPDAGRDTTLCSGTVIRLNGSGGAQYQWSPPVYLSAANVFNPVVTLPAAGTYQYRLTVSNGSGCLSATSSVVTVTMLPPAKVFAGNDTLVAAGQPVQLNAADINNAGFVQYTWSPGTALSNVFVKNPVAVPANDITYVVTAHTVNGCTATDEIRVKVFAGPALYVPNAFSPNGDGLNDVFRPVLVGIRELRVFAVYNRYGELLYSTTRQGAGWDGMYKGARQNAGAYVWVAEAVDYKGSVLRRQGSVVLVR